MKKLMLFACLGALVLLIAGQVFAEEVAQDSPFDPAKLGRFVVFPGIDQPARVAGLFGAAGTDPDPRYADRRLPDKIVHKLIRARDRNAFWLLCEDRRDYSSIAYTYVFATNRSVRAVEGPYDRGVYFKVPSEYVLFQSDVSQCTYLNEDGYFKMILAPTPMPENRFFASSPIPDYIKWASPFRVSRPNGWMPLRHILVLDEYRLKENFVNGCELWFAEDDSRLVKEFITEPAITKDEEGNEHYDFDDAQMVKEVQYDYTDRLGNTWDYPAVVTVFTGGWKALEMEFHLADGFWMLHRGKLYTKGADDDLSIFGFFTGSIVVKR